MAPEGHASPEYRRYLKSPIWQARKRRYYQTHPRACAACDKRPVMRKWWKVWKSKDWLHLHHLDYSVQRSNPGHEPDDSLRALCRRCHEETHARHNAGQFGSAPDSLRRCTLWVIQTKQRKLKRQRIKRDRKIVKAASGNRKIVKALTTYGSNP